MKVFIFTEDEEIERKESNVWCGWNGKRNREAKIAVGVSGFVKHRSD